MDGWQTDNEWGCHSTTRSYGGASAVAFREWLEQKYGTLDALNQAWGNVFWSQEYTAWSQIDPPYNLVTDVNPSHLLDFHRFASDAVKEFQAEQVAIIRELSPGRWVTHNYMMHFNEFDHYANSEVLDFASWDSYPARSGRARAAVRRRSKVKWARTGHPDYVSWNHDVYRGLKGRRAFWVMEQGAGQVNWAPSNCLPVEGAVQLWTAQAYAHGASCVSYFRWRAATIAQELMHSGLLRHDETLDRGGQEIARMEMSGRTNGGVPARVALLHDYESQWVYDVQPHSARASYVRQTMLFYTALRSLGLDVDIRHPDHDLSGYAVIVAPALQLMGQERADHLASYAGDTPARLRTAHRLPHAHRPRAGRWATRSVARPGRSATAEFRWTAPGSAPSAPAASRSKPGPSPTNRSTPRSSIAYDDGPLAGQAAVTRKGNAISIGAWSAPLVISVLEQVLAEAGVPTVRLPEGVRASPTTATPKSG